jgi:hypothetical protein
MYHFTLAVQEKNVKGKRVKQRKTSQNGEKIHNKELFISTLYLIYFIHYVQSE